MTDPAGADRIRPACLVLHGLGGGPYELAPLIDALVGSGVRVATPTLPGHDGPGPRMPASTWPEWARLATSCFDDLASAGGPVAVLGFSTGATLALELATRRPVAALVLVAPFLAIRHAGLIPLRPARFLGPIARILPDIPRRGPAVRDRAVGRSLRSVSRFRSFSLAATLSALELIDRIKPLVPAIGVPTLILQGDRDSVVDPGGAAWLARHLGSPRKELIRFARSDHLLALDFDRPRVVQAMLAFLGSELGPDRDACVTPGAAV